MKTRFLLAMLFAVVTTAVFAQKGIVSGHVKDKATGDDAIGASVMIDGTTTGATTDIYGKFSFQVEAGTYNIVVSYIGFQKLTVEGLEVKAGEEVNLTLQLESADEVLQEVVIKGTADRSSESVLLVQRKNAVELLQSIGSAELARKGITDAEAAVTQVTGVSKQEGVKNVFVRGLGDRYNSTSLNNLPLPSEDPQFKNITLDFFSSDIISSIDVNKTFGPSIGGDVAGANVNIVSRKLFDDTELNVSASVGMNSQVAGKNFYRADGTNFFGTASRNYPISNISRYDFKDSYQPNQVDGPLTNLNFSVSGGKNFMLGNGSLKTFFVGNFGNDHNYKTGIARYVLPWGAMKRDYDFERSEYKTSQIGLASILYEFGEDNSIWYNALYIHDNKQSVTNYNGFDDRTAENVEDPNAHKSFLRRQQQNNNNLLLNQLISEIHLNNKLSLNLGGSFSIARGDEPDRRQSSYGFNGDEYITNTNSSAYLHRFFSALKETDITGSASATYQLKENSNNKITAGYTLRSTVRDFEYIQYNFDFPAPTVVSIDNPDALFNQQSIDDDAFEIVTGRGTGSSALKPLTYSVDRQIHAGFVSTFFDISPQLTLNVGVRYEAITQQKIRWDVGTDIDDPSNPTDNFEERSPAYVLPSLNIKYNLSEDNILRLGASQSYTMPQFKELAPFLYEDVNQNEFGNPKLKPAENINVDLRFEHYFNANEFISVTGFYKNIKNTINRTLVSSAGNETSFVNTGEANATGIEMEFRKNLFQRTKEDRTNGLSFGVNVSYLYSNQELKDDPDDDLVVRFNDKEAALEGASPWLMNSDLTYTREDGNGKTWMTAVVFSYFSDRIFALGAPEGHQHIYERGVPTLDLISKFGVSSRLAINLNVRNILNPYYRTTKALDSGKDEIVSRYKRGVISSIGVSYKF